MSIGGLYLPMPHHSNTFCHSSEYVKCHQYIKGCELLMIKEQHNNDFIVLGDRRKLRRFANRFNVRLAAFDPSSTPRKTIGLQAMTLDVSLGGLRLEAMQELPSDTIVGFELKSDRLSQGMSGVGKVRWSAPQQESDKFEIGLSFCNDFNTTEAIRKCLDQ